MSGISVAVLGLAVHASQRNAPHAAAVAPAGLVQTPSVVATTPSAPSAPATTRPRASSRATTPRATATSAKRPPAAATAPARRPPQLPHPTATTKATPKPTASTVTVTVNGSPADTRYGPVQVQISVRAGHIIRADAIAYPQGGGRDQEINSQAVPQLDQETVQADSANIDTVS
ncbi:MAG: hypothetical protein JWO12_3518, partial [Frankiales bacterium]|nr:hypothetical protein [Frankiales bacterium]